MGHASRGPSADFSRRPSCDRIFAYRAYVDDGFDKLVAGGVEPGSELARVIEVGINHEQQHQELLLTDILALFAANPLRPVYRAPRPRVDQGEPEALRWIEYPGGIHEMGHAGNGFAWDNETPRHRELIHPFKITDRLITNAEWLDFIEDGGYRNFSLWLADGWTMVNREGWHAPLYWEEREGQWLAMSLEGLRPLDRAAPVAHVSYYEADAFARWAGRRLPTEFEWELAAKDVPASGNTLASKALRPLPAGSESGRSAAPIVWRRLGMDRRTPICPILAIARPLGRLANTTASSWSASRSCAAVHARRRKVMRARPIAISSILISAGSSWACALPRRSLDVDDQ